MESQNGRRFEDFYLREERRVLRLCFGVLGDRELARDCAQEAWIRYLRYAEGERPQFSVPLLVTIALNASRDGARQQSRRPEELRADVPEPPGAPHHDDDDDLLKAISRLPQAEREAVVMRYALDLPITDIAAALHRRTGAVKSLLHRARGRLRAMLTEEEISHGHQG